MPPPSGSPSMRMVRSPARAARTASAQARVEAPAPPLPPITPTARAGRPAPSTTSAMRSTSRLSASGSRSTSSAPISTARCHTWGSSRSRPTRNTPALRGAPRTRRAASSPTSTSGADSHPAFSASPPVPTAPPCSGTACRTCGSAPAAAHSRSRSSSSSGSSVMISGRPPPGADPAMDPGPRPAPRPVPLPPTTDSGDSHDFDRATISAPFSLQMLPPRTSRLESPCSDQEKQVDLVG